MNRTTKPRRSHTRWMREKRTYICWLGMIHRCTNPKNQAYKYYGGRGITVCERWMEFENFLADMGYAPRRLTLERVNNNAGYCKANCRWIPLAQQSNNRTISRWITFKGVRKTLADWGRHLGISRKTLRSRISMGWPLSRVLDGRLIRPSRPAKLIQCRGEKRTMLEWAMIARSTKKRIWGRLNLGWDVESAIFDPIS